MAHRQFSDEPAEIPMSAMIDIVFLLLIYFILTFKPQLVESRMAINLPQPNAAQDQMDAPPPQLLDIEVHPDTYLLLGRKSVGLEGVREALTTAAAWDPTQTVMIKVHPEAREGAVIDLLDICADLDMSNISVLTLLIE